MLPVVGSVRTTEICEELFSFDMFTATPVDLLGAKVPSPAYCATTVYWPPGKKDVLNAAVFGLPPARVAKSIPVLIIPAGPTIETSPVAPLVTVELTLTEVPCLLTSVFVEPLSVRLVVDGVKFVTTVFQAAARLVRFTEPSPVAKSYPAVAVHAGVVAWFGSTITPSEFALQFAAAPPLQGTELFPLVISLKEQVDPVSASVVELQAAVGPACPAIPAIVYKTGFTFPWRPPSCCTISAIIPANAGAAADVPPAPPIT